MNRTTSLPLTSLSMNCSMLMICPVSEAQPGARGIAINLPLWRAGLQRQCVQLAAHLALERLIDDLVLGHPRLAAERLGDDGRGVVVAIAGEIADRHQGVRNA